MPSRWRRGVAALTAINRHAYPSFAALLARAQLSHMMKRAGAIQVHETAASLRAGLARLRSVPEDLTGGVSLLDADALYAAVPALAPGNAGGVLIPSTGVLSDPLDVVRGLADYARARGATIRRARVVRVRPTVPGRRADARRRRDRHLRQAWSSRPGPGRAPSCATSASRSTWRRSAATT